MRTRNYGVRIPESLFADAREALGMTDDSHTTSDIVRAALARVAGTDPGDYALPAPGWRSAVEARDAA